MLSRFDTNIFLNHHTLIFRINNEFNKYGIDSYYLLYLLTHRITKQQFFNKIMVDTTLPNIGERWKELLLPLHNNEETKKQVKEEIKKLFEEKWQLEEKIESLKKRFD